MAFFYTTYVVQIQLAFSWLNEYPKPACKSCWVFLHSHSSA